MGRRAWTVAAVACAAALVGTASALAASGVTRRVASATQEGWQGTYTNGDVMPQRVVLRPAGDWFYRPREACTQAGVPWSLELRAKAGGLVVPECAPWSLVGRLQVDDQVETFCVTEQDHFVMPPGAQLSFAINEFKAGYQDNSGTISVEILAVELGPSAQQTTDGGDGVALDVLAR